MRGSDEVDDNEQSASTPAQDSSGSSLSPTSTVGSIVPAARNVQTEPRVRFSYDENRPSKSVCSQTAAHEVHSAGHGRSRGYSLRRSLFAQNIQRRDQKDAQIELKTPRSQSGKKSPTERAETVISVTEAEGIEDAPVNRKSGRRRRGFYTGWLSTISNIPDRIDTLFQKKPLPPSPNGRRVVVTTNDGTPPIDERTNKPHIDNTIISCRYTPWNFFPRQLAAQFSKLANFYFLCIAILQMIPGLSTTGQYTTIVPLLIFVLISMAKEGYDDLRRHKLDKEDNLRDVEVLVRRSSSDSTTESDFEGPYTETPAMTWQTRKWQKVTVGDVVLLERDEPIPADVIVLHADEPTGSAFVETKSLDGETNLKTKKPLKDLSGRCGSLDSVANLEAEFIVEDPNLDLYKFDGKVTVGGQTLPLTNGDVIYRGSILRNTPAALGLVIYSGEECKIRMNANKNPRTKAPALQADVNRVVMFVAALVFSIAIIMTPLHLAHRRNTGDRSWYLHGARVPLGHIWTSFVIMFNTMLPLSLYVSLEIVKVAQMFLMNDVDMYDAENDVPMEPHTSTINEELGQVSYIFSDKTGTLTNNSMKFRKMSVAGSAWLHDVDLQEQAMRGNQKPKLRHKKRRAKGKEKTNAPAGHDVRKSTTGLSAKSRMSTQSATWKPNARTAASLHCGKTEQLTEYLQQYPESAFAEKTKLLLLALALCHTALPEKDDNGDIEYQASSPDEVALVTAAKDMGYTVTDRQAESITIQSYPNGTEEAPLYETYHVLDVVEFSSVRKRMSIVIRLPDGRICLFTKGADTTIRHLLRQSDYVSTSTTNVHRRASERRSLEAQQALRRQSTYRSAKTDPKRSNSLSVAMRPSLQAGRASVTGISARQSVDAWLKDRESEVDMSIPRDSNTFYTPRQSTQLGTPRASGFTNPRHSIVRANSVWSSAYGLETLVDEEVAANDQAIFEHCFQHIDDFATEGLRTLLYGCRFLSEDEYREWRDLYAEASTSLVDRLYKMEAAGALIETSLELLGATAIEDKLQDGVPDAIERFRRAGIKMWMLTGDKRETAINIGQSCRLIKGYSNVIILDQQDGHLIARMENATRDIQSGRIAHSVLVIDGQTLTAMEDSEAETDAFADLAILADSVICCRASPSQKAKLVRTIRFRVKGSVTLAIGDGANDIAMIQEAHVGIGIAGKEGLQAARTSDYSIGQFRFLLKLLLVHGRWNYVRICKYTLGTFWKEMIFYLVQAMYQYWNGYTGTSLYEPWSLSMFNTLFTSLPVIFMGVFEQDMRPATLLAVPELYSIGQQRRGFNFRKYLYWATLGAIEAVLVWFIVYGLYGEALVKQDYRVFSMGCLAFTACVTFISLKLQGLELHNKTIMAAIAIFCSVGGWWLWNMILGAMYNVYDPIYDVRDNIYHRFGRSMLWWLTLIAAVLALVIFEMSIKCLWYTIKPGDTEIFQALEKDPAIKRRFEESAAELLQQGWDRGDKKSSVELEREAEEQIQREAEVQQMLEKPRTMESVTSGQHTMPPNSSSSAEPLTHGKAAQVGDREGLSASEDGRADPKRSSTVVDVGELFSKGFGKVKKGQLK